MVDTVYVTIASIAIFCVLVPMPWHFSAWNMATVYMMTWCTIGCIIHIVDGSLWYHNIHLPSGAEKVWCDIASKLIIGLSIALPLSSLSINRRLYNIAAVKNVTVTSYVKKRDAIIDTIVCVVVPMIFMAVHYTVQGHRFDIIEDFGCWPSTYLTAPGYALVVIPPILVGCVSLVFSLLSLYHFWQRRKEFNFLLRSSSTGLSSSRYFRLMALASMDMLLGLPFAIFIFVAGIQKNGVAKYVSWADTHYNFSRVDMYTTFMIKAGGKVFYASYQANRWAFPATALLFFVFFGFSTEARINYGNMFWSVLSRVGIERPVSGPGTSSSGISIFGRRFGRSGLATNDSLQASYDNRHKIPRPVYRESIGSVISTVPSLDLAAFDELEKKAAAEAAASAELETRSACSSTSHVDEITVPYRVVYATRDPAPAASSFAIDIEAAPRPWRPTSWPAPPPPATYSLPPVDLEARRLFAIRMLAERDSKTQPAQQKH